MMTTDEFAPQNYAAATKLENTELAEFVAALIDEWKEDGTLAILKDKYGI
jgi:ABC-type amino acid transport substrate-binding protein